MPATRSVAEAASTELAMSSPVIRSTRRKVYMDISEPVKVDSTPVKRAKTPLRPRKVPTKSQPATPRFDPDVHGADVDLGARSDSEDEFKQSITFSNRQHGRGATNEDKEVVADCESISNDSFSFSPVKWSAGVQARPLLQSTPLARPAKHLRVDKYSPRITGIEINGTAAKSSEHSSRQADSNEDDLHHAVTKTITTSAGKGRSRRRTRSIGNNSTQALGDATRSPRIKLKLVMPGKRSSMQLETLAVPDFEAQDRAIEKQKNAVKLRKYAQLPKRKPTVPRAPSFCTRPEVLSTTVNHLEVPTGGTALLPSSVNSGKQRKPKRKMSQDVAAIEHMESPAKRVRLDSKSANHPGLPGNVPAINSAAPRTSSLHSRARRVSRFAQQKSASLDSLSTAYVTKKQHDVATYSSTPSNALGHSISTTKPRPFVFATEERLNRVIPKATNKTEQKRKSEMIAETKTHSTPISRPQVQYVISQAQQKYSHSNLRDEIDKIAKRSAVKPVIQQQIMDQAELPSRKESGTARKEWAQSGRAKVEEWAKMRLQNGSSDTGHR